MAFNFYIGDKQSFQGSNKNYDGNVVDDGEGNQNQTTTYRHPDWPPEREPIPLYQRQSIGTLVDEILTANKTNQFTAVLEIGKSGSGKTTITQTIIHRLHEQYPYTIYWFEKKQIQNLVQIVKSLPKGVPCILAFQDASYAFNGLSDEELEEIAAKLTYIRHEVRARVVLFIQSHYSKAVDKFFRDTDITICTSITDNERTNIMTLFGSHNAAKINRFIRIYHNQLFKERFHFRTSSWSQETYYYKTNDPFRAALVSSVGECHYLLYPKEECGVCSLEKQKYSKLSAQEVLDLLVSSVGPTIARAAIRIYIFFVKGRKVLPSNMARALNLLSDMDHSANIDWDEVYDATQKQLKRKTGYRFTKKLREVKSDLAAKINKKYESFPTNTAESFLSPSSSEIVATPLSDFIATTQKSENVANNDEIEDNAHFVENEE